MNKSRLRPLEKTNNFAGFKFPRYIPRLEKGTKQQRIERYKHTGGYYTFGQTAHAIETHFYLDSDFMVMGRWEYCDEISRSIRHTGWYINQDCDDKIRGIVAKLSNGRFLAGYTMGNCMITTINKKVFHDELDAALYADELARVAAEQEQEYQLENESEY